MDWNLKNPIPPVLDFLDSCRHHKIDMKIYLQSLKLEAEKRSSDAERQGLRASNPKPPWEPLEVQIQRWWANAPDTVKSRPFQLIEIAGVCSGRYQARPALRCVAQALRALGWREYRCWKRSGRNRRFWILSSPVKSSVGVD